MNNAFTLKEFMYFGSRFIAQEEIFLRHVKTVDAGYEKELVAIIDRIEALQAWFGIRETQFASDISAKFALAEEELIDSLDWSADAELTEEKITQMKTERTKLVQHHLAKEQLTLASKFNGLNNYAMRIKLRAYNKFPSE